MVNFNKENIEWLLALTNQAISKVKDDDVKLNKLKNISNNLTELSKVNVKITISEDDIKNTNKLLEELKKLTDKYSKMSDISDVNQYDELKKLMSSKLQTLSTYKDIFLNESTYLEDYLKKEFRVKIIQEMMENDTDVNGKKVSFTQADKLVDIDSRYLLVKEKVRKVESLANSIKTKYLFYLQLWQLVFQSVSTASKEKFSTQNNND